MQVWCSHYETRCVFVAARRPGGAVRLRQPPALGRGPADGRRVPRRPAFYYFAAGSRAPERVKLSADQIADLMPSTAPATGASPSTGCEPLGSEALRAAASCCWTARNRGRAGALHQVAGRDRADARLAWRPARPAASDEGRARSPASPRTRSGPSCTRPTSAWAASGSRPGCSPPARAPIPGSASARCARSSAATSSPSTPT